MISYINQRVNVDSVTYVRVEQGLWTAGKNGAVDKYAFKNKESRIYENETLCFYGLKCVLDGGLNAFPETLKFKQEGMIAKNPEKKWYNDELDMYIESFSDAENYFRGEIVIDNKRVSLFGYEIGNNDLYVFESEQSELVWLWLEFSNDGKIIARACADSYYVQFFDDWSYKGESIVFLPV